MYYRVNFLLKKNKIASEDLLLEEKKAFIKEPIIDWQSPSENERWKTVQKDLEKRQIKYNIDNSANKEEEKELFIRTKKEIKRQILEYNTILNSFVLPKNETILQKTYSFFKRKPNNYMIKVEKYNETKKELDNLLELLYEINIQLPIYCSE
jgi:hypothetical protein